MSDSAPPTDGRRQVALTDGVGVALMVLGAVDLVGWVLDAPLLTAIVIGHQTMKPITAVTFAILGTGLLALGGGRPSIGPGRRAVALGCGAFVGGLGGATLLQIVSRTTFLPEAVVFREALRAESDPDPGRMAVVTAIAFVVLGAGVVARTSQRLLLTQAAAVTATTLGAVGAIGYLFDADALYSFSPYSHIALPTTLGITIGGIALSWSMPDRGLPALDRSGPATRVLLRRALPLVVLVPAAAGRVLIEIGRESQTRPLTTVLLASIGIWVAVAVVWVAARSVAAVDRSRHEVLDELARTNAELEERVAVRTAELQALGTHDALTGLPNRTLLHDRLEQGLARLRRGGDPFAVLFVDLDHFKVVNDSLGHSAGDRLLVAAAERIRRAVRGTDTVARTGGDEFVVLAEDCHDHAGAHRIAAQLRDALAEELVVDGRRLSVQASIGVALASSGDDSPDDLLRSADSAMYRAKERGRGRCEVFDDELRVRAHERLSVEEGLRRALATHQLIPWFQPNVDLRTKRVVGMEALARWPEDPHGITPDVFIPVAEETGLVVPLGRAVLVRAVEEAEYLWAQGHQVQVSVNVSARQLVSHELSDLVLGLLAASTVPPRALCIEVTESVLMDDTGTTATELQRIRAAGVSVAIDDFGTGWSSMAYVRDFPVDVVKVDKRFVGGLAESARDRAVVTGIVGLADALGILIVAEGVETAEQERILIELGAHWGQGHRYAKAMPSRELRHLLHIGSSGCGSRCAPLPVFEAPAT